MNGPALEWAPFPGWRDDDGLDEERRKWLERVAGGPGKVEIAAKGVGEIKPHTESGIEEGIKQLRTRKQQGMRVLLTYVPVNAGNRMTRLGRAAGVEVQAATWPNRKSLIARRTGPLHWTKVGTAPLPPTMPFPTVDDAGMFGAAVEPYVRRLFESKVVRPAGRTPRGGTGGFAPGADVVWNELAAFYAELAGEVGDPWLADLAEALAAA